MKKFFEVTSLAQVFEYMSDFPLVGTEIVPLPETDGRILAADIVSDVDLPDFARSTMDGFAVQAASTFGVSEGSPAYLTVKGSVDMGDHPVFSITTGEAARISTGGMLPEGADAVVMIEHIGEIDGTTIEVYRSVAPGQHVVEKGEDFGKEEIVLCCGQKIRPQEKGLLAAFGRETVDVYQKPVIGIISTGDEVVPVNEFPASGQIRDINTYTIASLVIKAGGVPVTYGIARDEFEVLFEKCSQALAQCDMVLISGGSSVGTRDFTIEALSALPDATILVHGISISPGKPTILAKVGPKAFWGLPGHVVSAMVVFTVAVQPFIENIGGLSPQAKNEPKISARLSRNVSSAQGRIDYIRVRLTETKGVLWAEPVLGKSGLIHTMIKADGLIAIGENTEGLDKGAEVQVIPF
ncbi:MAG: molybdopterin molybdotransferase MoeA [Deltaproteobacteria bacterium]|nr:molybdopterin molybdotransferase MoeA [Deltaproteobacteria bacterium]MBW2200487.1 molybdopterin molybdotransferase MoeA [Deltaproteobacteria bacterium]MBW2538816.1 molybdopterin molybdotransferase MoeA [Deltaproteobacteria bacterium]